MDEIDSILQRIDDRIDVIHKDLSKIQDTLRGDIHTLGMVAKVNILWKSWVWLLCTGSAAIGGCAVWLIERLVS